MTGRVVPLNASEHAAIDALLPWYVNGTLRGDELGRVERHVAVCPACRREVDWLKDVFAACADATPAFASSEPAGNAGSSTIASNAPAWTLSPSSTATCATRPATGELTTESSFGGGAITPLISITSAISAAVTG